jgi:hypothetical protein
MRCKRFKAGERREEEEYPDGSLTDEQHGSSLKDLQPFGLSYGGALAALLLCHPDASGRLCSFVAPCQRPALSQRTPFLFMRWVLKLLPNRSTPATKPTTPQ